MLALALCLVDFSSDQRHAYLYLWPFTPLLSQDLLVMVALCNRADRYIFAL